MNTENKEIQSIIEFARGKSRSEIAKQLQTTRETIGRYVRPITAATNGTIEVLTTSERKALDNIRKELHIPLPPIAKEIHMKPHTLRDYVYRGTLPKRNPNKTILYYRTLITHINKKLALISKHLKGLESLQSN